MKINNRYNAWGPIHPNTVVLMEVTVIEGIVENGKIGLRDPLSLAENTRVYVIVAGKAADPAAHIQSPRLANPTRAADLKKQIVEIATNA